MEAAAFRRLQRAWDLAFQDDLLLFVVDIRNGDGRQQRLGVGVQRLCKEVLLVRNFYNLAQIHNRDLIADVLHDAQVVGDKEVGQIHLFLQILEQVEHLGADRNVQRRNRLVADDHFGVVDQGPGDNDSLALAAGKFVRIFVQVFFTQADNIQHLDDPLAAFRLGDVVREVQRRLHRLHDGLSWIERCKRVLEDQLHLSAVLHHLVQCVFGNILPFIDNLAAGDRVQL